MDIEIRQRYSLELYGFSGVAVNQNFGEAGFKAMNRMWAVVKGRGLQNKGINVWAYDPGDIVFAGVELESAPPPDAGLERKLISLNRYAYFKHVGPYSRLKEVYAALRDEVKSRGLKPSYPGLEIYGHMGPDESKLETDILMAIE